MAARPGARPTLGRIQPVQEEAGEEVQGQGEVRKGCQEGQGPGGPLETQEEPEGREGQAPPEDT
jgi:hypothetical protein